MSISRRTVLGGMIATPLAAAVSAPAWAAPLLRAPLRIIADRRLAGGQALAAFAAQHGLPIADPEGEMIHLFLGACASWLSDGVPLIGVTGYADFVLISGLAREAGKRRAKLPGAEDKSPEALMLRQITAGSRAFGWQV